MEVDKLERGERWKIIYRGVWPKVKPLSFPTVVEIRLYKGEDKKLFSIKSGKLWILFSLGHTHLHIDIAKNWSSTTGMITSRWHLAFSYHLHMEVERLKMGEN